MLELVTRVDRECGCGWWVQAARMDTGEVVITDRDGRRTVEFPEVEGLALERHLDSRTYWSLKAHLKRGACM